MNWIATAFLAIVCVAVLGHGIVQRGRCYGYPFLAAGIFLTFVLPQAPGLLNDAFMPAEMMTRAMFFSALCLVMTIVGWQIGMRTKPARSLVFDERRLLQAATLLSLVGAYFFYKFGRLPDEERLAGFLSGTAVAYLFFAKLLTYGLAIAVLCYAQRPSRTALAVILFDCVFYFERIVLAGRRSDFAEFALILALALWFQRRWAVPRTAVLAGLGVALGSMLAAGDYRQSIYYSGERDWSAVLEIDLAESWNRLLENGGPEVRNLAFAMDHVADVAQYDLGVSHWNSLVHSYVPAQLLGTRFKESLFLDLPDRFPTDYLTRPGATSTGMMDAFASYWYFGWLKFFALGAVLGWLYRQALNGNTTAQLAYMLSAVPSMLVVTHFTNEILLAWVHIAAFLVPCLAYAAVRGARWEPSAAGSVPLAVVRQ